MSRFWGFFGPHPQLVIPESFELCLSYEEQVAYLNKYIEELEKRIEELEKKVLTTGE